MENRKVEVKSMVSYSVGLIVPDLHFERVFSAEGAVKQIDYEILREGLSEPGVYALFAEGILNIESEQDRIDLGLQEPGESINRFKTLSSGQILKMLKLDPIDVFTKEIDGLNREQVTRVADLAINEKVVNFDKAQVIKKKCGIDVIACIQHGVE